MKKKSLKLIEKSRVELFFAIKLEFKSIFKPLIAKCTFYSFKVRLTVQLMITFVNN